MVSWAFRPRWHRTPRWESVWGEAFHLMKARKQTERKEPGSQYPLQCHVPRNPTSFHRAPSPKDSSTSQKYHRLETKPSTHGAFGKHSRSKLYNKQVLIGGWQKALPPNVHILTPGTCAYIRLPGMGNYSIMIIWSRDRIEWIIQVDTVESHGSLEVKDRGQGGDHRDGSVRYSLMLLTLQMEEGGHQPRNVNSLQKQEGQGKGFYPGDCEGTRPHRLLDLNLWDTFQTSELEDKKSLGFLFVCFEVVTLEPRASYQVGKFSTIELHPSCT